MIRPYRPSDLPNVTAIYEERYPEELITEEVLAHVLASTPERARPLRLVAEGAGAVVGWGWAGFHVESERDDVAWVSVYVRPPARRRGLGGELFRRVEAHAVDLGAHKLLSSTRDDAVARGFAERRRFTHTFTRRVSSVDPREVDPVQLERLRAARRKDGFEVVPLAAFRDAPEAVHAVDIEASRDIPADEPVAQMPFEEWLEENWRAPLLTFDGSFVVTEAGRPVSFALLRAAPDRGKAANDMTGTLRAYRGRGLARLAKLATLRWAAENGITQVTTENDESNASMLALNVSLGYRPTAALLSWLREPA